MPSWRDRHWAIFLFPQANSGMRPNSLIPSRAPSRPRLTQEKEIGGPACKGDEIATGRPTANRLTARIAQNNAIAPGEMNFFTNIICSLPRLGANPDLIARQPTAPAFKYNRVPSG